MRLFWNIVAILGNGQVCFSLDRCKWDLPTHTEGSISRSRVVIQAQKGEYCALASFAVAAMGMLSVAAPVAVSAVNFSPIEEIARPGFGRATEAMGIGCFGLTDHRDVEVVELVGTDGKLTPSEESFLRSGAVDEGFILDQSGCLRFQNLARTRGYYRYFDRAS
jgi:hypothetical protein